MKSNRLITFLLLIGCLTLCHQAIAQTVSDSISIFSLIEAVEANTSYRIYTTIDKPFLVKKAETQKPEVEHLQKALTGTNYQITIYQDYIFVLPTAPLETSLPMSWHKDGEADKASSRAVITPVRATSENMVYDIGDKYKPTDKKQITLTGEIIDFKSGQPMVGINVIHRAPWVATVTDMQGRFTLLLQQGHNVLEISGVNIKDTQRQYMLYADGTTHIVLEEEDHLLDEVVITSGKVENVKGLQLGMEKFQPQLLKNIPTAMGEVDVLKMIQTLPGVKTVGEASNGYNVRGGATDQNLLLLNNGTIYNPNHLFGFFSAFNSDMVQDVELYKSSIPAQYGGRISSVLNITGKEASKEKFTGAANIGLVTSKLNLEIPLVKEKMSLLLSGRTTYSDWIMKRLPEKSGYKNGNAGFYDLGATWSYTIDHLNKVNVYGYYSHDRFEFNENEKYAYSNLNASVNWRTILNEKVTANLAAGYDHYDYMNDESTDAVAAARLKFAINQVYAKVGFNHDLGNGHKLNYGLSTMLYDLQPGIYEPLNDSSTVVRKELQTEKALESALYIGDQWEINSKLSIDAGIRLSMFNALGKRTYYDYATGELPSLNAITDTITTGGGAFKTYFAPEFRLSARYAFSDDLSVKAGFNTMQQYIHKLSNTVIMSPTDTWKLSDKHIKPQRGWQLAGGMYYNTPDKMLELSLEGYYKKLIDYLDYRSGAQLIMNEHIETDVINTEGYAYGVEFQVKKPEGKLNGWLSYTYSRTFLRQNDPRIANPANRGEWYPTQYDKPHDFKLIANYKFTRRYSMSLNLDYSTGRPTTVPAGKYWDKTLNRMLVYYTDRNSYRVPDYFRVDWSFNIEPSHHLTLLTHSSISIGVYNVTGRKNVYSIYYVPVNNKIQGYKMSIFGTPIPFVTYNIKF